MSKTVYEKFCHNPKCRQAFTSTARNQKYCGDECLAEGRKQARGKQRRRRNYRKHRKVRRKESMSRKQAREHGLNHMVQWPCMMCGEVFFLKDLELHHRDGNPHNNATDCSNFALLCNPCHSKADTQWRKEKKAGQEISEVRQMTGQVEAISWHEYTAEVAPYVPKQEKSKPKAEGENPYLLKKDKT